MRQEKNANSFLSNWFYRSIKDLLAPPKKLPNEKIVINPDETRIWMVGHATVLINIFGTTILTDPVLVNGLPFPRRLTSPGYTAGELPPLDYIVVSHAHLDHLNKPTLRGLAQKTKAIIVPKNCTDLVEWMGFGRVIELGWNQKFSADDFSATAYKVKHWGQRVPWERKGRGYNSYVMEKNGRSIYFGGDTGYDGYFKAIGGKHHISLALLPIGAYKPDAFSPNHMNPEEAIKAAEDLGSEHVIPIHWGNFRLSLESIFEPPERFLHHAGQNGMAKKAHLLQNGESFGL